METRNLVIFRSDNGYQIPIQHNNTLTFTVIGKMADKGDRGWGWRSDAKGCIGLDTDASVTFISLTDNGSTYGFEAPLEDTSVLIGLIDEVRVSAVGLEKSITVSFTEDGDRPIGKWFDFSIGCREVSTGGDNSIYEYFIERVSLRTETVTIDNDGVSEEVEIDHRKDFYVNLVAEGEEISAAAVADAYYPTSQFLSSVMMESVSTGLAATISLFILEERVGSDGKVGYYRPRSENGVLRLEFPEGSNCKVLKLADEYFSQDLSYGAAPEEEKDFSKAYWSQFKTFDLAAEYGSYGEDSTEPLVVTIGFTAEDEGCYQDVLTVFTARGLDDASADLKFDRKGYIVFKNEAIGEDERYRTLFANFGIPDPKDYPNLFKDIEIYEEGEDWKFLNKKSKELFLSYPEIFPYVGTYKALLNAVNFLGYDDVYFKEWYSYFDGKTETSLSYQSVDISAKSTLQSKLTRAGVSLEEFLDWKKLSQLSLMYQINRQDGDYEVLRLRTANGVVDKTFQIPTTEAVYTYLNTEVLAKLHALKEWLEAYIININCKIIDVTGEGVVFGRLKSAAYPSPVYTNFDIRKQRTLTPKFVGEKFDATAELRDGSCDVDVTLLEAEDYRKTFAEMGEENLRFADFIDKKVNLGDGKGEFNSITPVSDFDAGDYHLLEDWLPDFIRSERFAGQPRPEWSEDAITKLRNVFAGPVFNQNLNIDSVQYELSVSNTCSSLRKGVGYYDSSGGFVECPLIADDNELHVHGWRSKEIEFVQRDGDKEIRPIIRIQSGKLRRPYGKWSENIAFNVKGFFDTKLTRTRFVLQESDGGDQQVCDDFVTLYPKEGARLLFSERNKYGIPLLIAENYDTFEGFLIPKGADKLILDIEEGFIDIDESNDNAEGISCTGRLSFEVDYDERDNSSERLYISHVYRSPQKTLTLSFDDMEIGELIEDFRTAVREFSVADTVKSLPDRLSVYDDLIGTVLPSLIDSYNNRKAELETLKALKPQYGSWYDTRIAEMDERIAKAEKAAALVAEGKAAMEREFNEYLYKDYTRAWFSNLVSKLDGDIKAQRMERSAVTTFTLNHIGDYELTAKATDNFNVPYATRSDRKLHVTASAPETRVNTSVEAFEGQEPSKMGGFDRLPRFIPEYPRPVKGVDTKSSELSYQDYSYFNRTPQAGDHIHLTNTTEKVADILDITERPEGLGNVPNLLKVSMVDENPDHQKLYRIGSRLYLSFVDPNSRDIADRMGYELGGGWNASEFIYDPELDRIVARGGMMRFSGPYTVVGYEKVARDTREENDNVLWLTYDDSDNSFQELSADMLDLMRKGTMECYAIACTRIDLSLEDIVNEPLTRTATITFDGGSEMLFSKGQCVKVNFSELVYKKGLDDETLSLSAGGEVEEKYLGGTSYKVLDAYFDYRTLRQTYVINGMVNTDLIRLGIYKNGVYNRIDGENPENNISGVPYGIRCTLSPAHWFFTKYTVLALDDAREDGETGKVRFGDDWFAGDYVDDTFSMTLRKFHTEDAFNDWKPDFVGDYTLYPSTSPLTIRRRDFARAVDVMLDSRDTGSIGEGGYSTVWDVMLMPTPDKDSQYLLYQVINEKPTLRLFRDGEYRMRLTAIDKYGNKTVNDSQGVLKVVTV